MHPSPFRLPVVVCALVWLHLLWLSGCGDEGGVHSYTIPKPEALALANPPVEGSAPAPDPVDRMLGAIIPRGPQIWFFKMVGENKPVNDRIEEFASFIGSVEIGDGDDAKPSWTLPEGWSQKPGNSMRYATIVVDAPGGPLELSVSALPAAPGDVDNAVLANVNRWRGQMGLPPTDQAGLAGEDSRTEETRRRTINGMTVTLVNLVGKYSAGGMGGAPFASGRGPAGPSPPPSGRASRPAGVKYQTPEGWQQGKGSAFSVASFQVVDGEKSAAITLTPLPRSDLFENVNRWRDQLQLERLANEQLAGQLQKVPVGTETGDFVELAGTGEGGKPAKILGIAVDHGSRSWFFKLIGDPDLADREKTRFLEFAKSVQFE